jgi:predicted alpha/beta superfamily hydrolase
MAWEPHPTGEGHTVVGDVRVLRGVDAPQLDDRRDLFAYLPPSHGSGRRFPVVYMQDGNNLFDEAVAHAGEWRVDEAMEELAREGIEAIVVGIPHGLDRGGEYAGAKSDAYLEFLADTVRPLVADAFDVDPRPESTGIAGSSLGAVISLHGVVSRPDVFGLAGVFSPAFWWDGGRMFDLVERDPPSRARVYMDVGDSESDDEAIRRSYVEGFERMRGLLERQGLDDGSLLTVLEAGGVHHESVWARRLPNAFRFLLG